MYKALYKNNPINLLLSSHLENKELLTSTAQRTEYVCPVCKEPVTIVWGTVRAPHFRHNTNSNCFNSAGESLEHMTGKKLIYEYFLNLVRHKASEIDIEHYIPETGQLADVYIKFNNGVQWVVEYQRSNISTTEINKRRELYKSAGIRDIWIVGDNVIKDDGMLICGVLNVGQTLIDEFFGKPSLISLDPDNEPITIFRGLNPLNSKSYTVETISEYKLEDICFNLWGEIFGIEDYLTQKFDRSYQDYQEVKLHSLTHHIEKLYPSKLPGFNFKFQIKSENEDIQYNHINIPEFLQRFLPIELVNINLVADLVKDPITYNQSYQYLNVVGVYPNRWETKFRKQDVNEYLPLSQWPVTKGWLLEALQDIYSVKFQTEKEFLEEIRLMENENEIPHYTKMYWLKKHGVLEEEILKTELRDTISLESALQILIRKINKEIKKQEVKNYAIQKSLIENEDLNNDFNIKQLLRIVVRLKKLIPVSEHHHNAFIEGKGFWDDETLE